MNLKMKTLLNVDVSKLDLKSVEVTQWTDSCLGLGQPNESCAQVITPGFRITFSSAGQTYTYRVDMTATTVRQEP